jgi:hypothetical protein
MIKGFKVPDISRWDIVTFGEMIVHWNCFISAVNFIKHDGPECSLFFGFLEGSPDP